jgi:hypothetical protein
MRFRLLAAPIVGLGVAMAVLACGNNKPDAPAPASGPPPLPPVVDAGPPPASFAPCDAVQSSAMTAALQARAAGEAPGMKPEGAALCGVVGEGGEVASAPFMLEQGYCYTVLGEGLPPVVEVDMVLKLDLQPAAGMPVLPPLVALGQSPLMVDTMQGLHAGMGMKNGCYQWTLPLPAQAKIVVKSAKGGPGPVAAQLYKKKK